MPPKEVSRSLAWIEFHSLAGRYNSADQSGFAYYWTRQRNMTMTTDKEQDEKKAVSLQRGSSNSIIFRLMFCVCSDSEPPLFTSDAFSPSASSVARTMHPFVCRAVFIEECSQTGNLYLFITPSYSGVASFVPREAYIVFSLVLWASWYSLGMWMLLPYMNVDNLTAQEVATLNYCF